MAVINKTNSIMEFPLQISRQYGAPIERYSVFYNQVDAETYATTSPLAYVGQIIAIVDEGTSTSTAYIISNTAGDLVEIGSGSAQPMLFVANESAMLGLTDIEPGQQVYREDTNTIWIFKGGDASQLSQWVESASQNDTVWNGTENKVIFYALTEANYKSIGSPDTNTLYFLTDTGRVMKGAADLTKSVLAVDAIPSVGNAILDKLYINKTTYEAKLTVDNTNWITLTPGYLTDGANWASADSSKFATIGLIKTGISEAISSVSTDASFDSAAGTIKVSNGAAATLSGVAHGVTYDSAA